MPQCSDEIRNYWGGIDERPALDHLKLRGFTVDNELCIHAPTGHVMTERDSMAVDLLVFEWDFGFAGCQESA